MLCNKPSNLDYCDLKSNIKQTMNSTKHRLLLGVCEVKDESDSSVDCRELHHKDW